MKSLLICALLIISSNTFSQTKARKAVLPKSVQAHDAVNSAKTAKKEEAPCDSKEDILKKLEEKKKAQASANKGFSLQGNTDAGCTLK